MKSRLFELDAIRGLAAVSVVCYHFTGKKEIAGDAYHLFLFGVTGVDLFFMLSGFVIFLTLTNTKRWQDFVINRFIRLYPTYWIACTFTALLILMDINHAGVSKNLLRDYLINLTMFQHYFAVPDLDGPYWTLIIEMLFYISILMVFLFRKMDKIETLGFIALFGIMFYDTVLQQFLYRDYFLLKHYFKLVNHFSFFFAGILFYKIKFEGLTTARFLGLILCYVVSLMLFDNASRGNRFMDISYYAFFIAVYFSIWIVYILGKLQFINNRVTVFLGRISYSLYLTHQFLSLELITYLFNVWHFNFWFTALITLSVALSVASFITIYLEEPIIRQLRNKFLKKKARMISVINDEAQ